MAVWADRPEVINRVDLVAGRYLRQLEWVVDVDEAAADWTVPVFEGEVTDGAAVAQVFQAAAAGSRITLVAVDFDSAQGALWE